MRIAPMRLAARLLIAGALAAGAAGVLGGCGSKISEANYYKVQHGMTEEDVDDLLGPAHGVGTAAPAAASTPPESPASPTTVEAATRPADRKVKTWTRGGLTIRVVFADGVVVGRSAVGLPFEDGASTPAGR